LSLIASTNLQEAVKQLDLATKYYQYLSSSFAFLLPQTQIVLYFMTRRMNSTEFSVRSKNWLAMLEACLGDLEKVANFLQEFVQRRKDGSISQGDVDELFNSKQLQTYFKGGHPSLRISELIEIPKLKEKKNVDVMEVLRIVYRVEISFDITKDFVPESEASGISRAVEKVKTLNDQMEANLKALNVAVLCWCILCWWCRLF